MNNMQRVIISNYDEYGDPVDGAGVSANSILPMDVQSRLQTTIQTHNAVSVGALGSSLQTSWIDCDGFNDIAVTFLNDASTNSYAHIQWSNDGISSNGRDYNVIPSDSNQYKAGCVPIKARYAKVQMYNGDSALAHTMSAWAYLKC